MRVRWCLAALLLAGCLRLANYRPHCTQDSDCPGDDVCDGQFCVDRCVELPDSCFDGQNCQNGHCVNDGCTSDGQCGAGTICTDRKCVPGCRETRECDWAHSMGCVDSICQPATLCTTGLDCPSPQTCQQGACAFKACGGSNGPCYEFLKCVGGRCVLPETTPDAGAPPDAGPSCGGPGQACCAGFRCVAGCCALVAASTFACVSAGTSCGGAVSGLCMAGSCGTCGAVGQRCCSDSFDRWCTAANAVCDSVTSVCKACGDHLAECCGVTSLSNAVPDTISGCIAAGATCQSFGNRFVCFP